MIGPITIKDVAALAEVSVSTASRAVRNHPDVRPETRERVLQAKYQLERNAHVPQLVAATASSRSAGAFALASMAAKASRAGGGVGMMNAAKLARRTPKRLESRIADLRGS